MTRSKVKVEIELNTDEFKTLYRTLEHSRQRLNKVGYTVKAFRIERMQDAMIESLDRELGKDRDNSELFDLLAYLQAWYADAFE